MAYMPSRREVSLALGRVRLAVSECQRAYQGGDRAKAYAAAEEAQHAAFNLKILFGLKTSEITTDSRQDGPVG
jgi:hypothetical protein